MSINKTHSQPLGSHRLAVWITSAKIRAKNEGNRNNTWSVRLYYIPKISFDRKVFAISFRFLRLFLYLSILKIVIL